MKRAVLAVMVLVVSPLSVSAADNAPQFRIDPKYQALLDSSCTKCHDASKYMGRIFTEKEWEEVLKKMQVNGAKFNYDEMKAVKWSR